MRGAPVPGGRPNAEPGGGRASGAATRRRLDQIRLNSATKRLALGCSCWSLSVQVCLFAQPDTGVAVLLVEVVG